MEDAVVNQMFNSSCVHYALIAGLRTETGLESFVIAYQSESALRDLIAAPSIIAAGFSSREEAAAGSRAYLPPARERITGREIKRCHQEVDFAEPRRDTRDRGTVLRKLARFVASSYGDIAATVFVIFASKNVVSAVLRMALGSSL
jgi:hypothetical protein